MWLDPKFNYLHSVFANQINIFCDSILERVLPTFDNLDEEAEKIADEEYERLGHLPATGDNVDMADLAERAQDAGVEYFISMTNVRQALLNLATAGLYHLFEQQRLLFRPRNGRMSIEGLPSWAKLNELRLVANAVKHGEGTSAKGLRDIRRDLFVHPALKDHDLFGKDRPGTIEIPLSGEDIYVKVEDLQDYRQAILSFWNAFGELILKGGAG